MKLFSKEILILIFVLFGSIIIFSSYEEPSQQTESTDTIEESSQNGIPSLFKDTTENLYLFEESSNVILSPALDAGEESRGSSTGSFGQSPQDDIIVSAEDSETPLSLETALDQVEDLALKFKLEFENIRHKQEDCHDCNQPENPSPSICATILAQLGGTSCDCKSLRCLESPKCANPCCCVCCSACCN